MGILFQLHISNFNCEAYKFLFSGWCSEMKSLQFFLLDLWMGGRCVWLFSLTGVFSQLSQFWPIHFHLLNHIISTYIHKTLPNEWFIGCYCINERHRERQRRDGECDSYEERNRRNMQRTFCIQWAIIWFSCGNEW